MDASQKRALRPSEPAFEPTDACEVSRGLGAQGFAVVRGFLARDELRVLRRECDALAAATSASALVRQGCVLDMLAQSPIRDDDDARTDSRAFLAARSAQLATHGVAPEEDAAVVERLLFERLPAVVARLLDGETAEQQRPLFFFNEHFVVKPPTSAVEFRWHRDDDEQLAMCVHRAAVAPYVSAWCALDDVTLANGPLRFLPLTDPASRADDGTGSEWLGPGGAQVAAFDAGATAPLLATAGDVLVFRSDVWHASSANESSAARRAFYAQFSLDKITASPTDPSPLSFAIPCAHIEACAVPGSSRKRQRASLQSSIGSLVARHDSTS